MKQPTNIWCFTIRMLKERGDIMKKKTYALVCIMSMSIGLMSCAKTPQEEIVVDRSEGIPKESILEKDDDVPKDLQIPNHWHERIERSDGFVTLEADCSPQIPEIYNTPVDVYEQLPLNDELLEELCDYFTDGNPLYEYPRMTKDQLESEKARMENYEGTWASLSGGLGATQYWQDQLSKMDQLIDEAPEKARTKDSIKPILMEPVQTERDFYDGVSDYYYDTDEKIGFTAKIDKGNEKNPLIRAVSYSDKLGSTSNFLYSQGTFIDEEYLLPLIHENLDSNNKNDAWLKTLKEQMEEVPSLSEEEALKEAKALLHELSITGFEVGSCVKAIGNRNTETWVLWDEDNPFNEVGFSIYFYRTLGDVMGYSQRSPEILEGIPETVYAPQFSAEKIQIIITKDGVQKFAWTNMSKKIDTVADNTKLLSFDEIKEKLADHLLYSTLADDGDELKDTGSKCIYNVINIQIRAANINAFEEPEKVWLVPVWVFDLEKTGLTSAGEILKWGTETVVLNAIDGGFVTIKRDE